MSLQDHLVFFLANYLAIFEFELILRQKENEVSDYEMEEYEKYTECCDLKVPCRQSMYRKKKRYRSYFNSIQSEGRIFLLDFPNEPYFRNVKCFYKSLDTFMKRYKGNHFHIYERNDILSRLTVSIETGSELYLFCCKNYEEMFDAEPPEFPDVILCIDLHRLDLKKYLGISNAEYDYFWIHHGAQI